MTLEILTSDTLAPVRHGFFTRRGGASSGIFSGLNCGLGSSDQREVVTLNRKMVAKAMGTENEMLAGVHQIHSEKVHVVTPDTVAERPEADALVTNCKGIGLSVLAADCAPILFADAKAGVIGAAHSGWKGAIGGVISGTVEAMVQLGANRDDIKASIGPCISQRSYEVGQEFLEQFMDEDPDFSRFFTNGSGDRYLFDLPGFCLHQLRETGLAEAHWIGHCTYLDENRFFSYRRATHRKEADYGRLISAIIL
ncbi:peptidoglycan editing factor PgeF [Neptunicoccus sediminis]|uniref:peptidoglycan editing factor PgeF n=1 Tax=Neptunicoccus sediminis TaxID=1892596 RepID=UPI000845E07C|nr:peptidoglycan editing factor PgeF [Neptunicoccus sediminis]